MGARVIAAARNESKLKNLLGLLGPKYDDRLSIVQLTGDAEADTKAIKVSSLDGKGADCYVDFAPPEAGSGTPLRACLLSLKPNDRASIMGGVQGDVGVPLFMVVMQNLQPRGKLMYHRADVTRSIGW